MNFFQRVLINAFNQINRVNTGAVIINRARGLTCARAGINCKEYAKVDR